jgi:hypothetical protein
MINETSSSDDYDTPWKDALTRYLPEFLAFYFPTAHSAIDWTRPHTFLDQELAQVVREAELGKRWADRLVEVATHESGTQWVYIHLEVQGQPDDDFAERLFVYNYRLYDRYQRPVATLAVLADERPGWKPQCYGYELFGCRHYLEFPTVKLLDYALRLEILLNDSNPFALVTAAHLLTQQTRHDPQARYAAKWRLARLLYERDWDKQRIIDLFAVIDWLLHLPPDWERQLWRSIHELERNVNMPYVTSIERIGRQEGRQEGEASLLRRLLVRRFGELPPETETKLTQASTAELEIWGERVLDAPTLAAVFNDDSDLP